MIQCLSALLLLVTLCCSPALVQAAPSSPNVLFIAIDDLNDWVGFLGGHPQALTPNMDRLAARGIVFTNAHCASPACNPSRAAVFSGRMPWETGVWSNKHKKLLDQQPDLLLLPEMFQEAGYDTFGTGKLLHSGARANKQLFQHHFNVEQRWSPFRRDLVRYSKAELPSKSTAQPRHTVHWKGREFNLPLNGMPSDRAPESPEGESFDWGPLDISDEDMGDTQITDWAIGQLENIAKRNDSKPFFLGIGYYRPHIPLYAPAKYFRRFENKQVTLPPVKSDDLDDLSETAKSWATKADTGGLHATVVSHGQWREAVKSYLACTTFVDAQIGRLLEALDTGDLGNNTVVVLWSDHGWHLGEKQHWGKWTGWERSTRVPLIVVPPRSRSHEFAQAGSRCDRPVSLIDLYPTLVELCDLKAPQGLDGESLVPLLRNPKSQSDRVAVTSFNPGNVSVRNDRWRLVRYRDGSRELYDLQDDPNEWTNLAGDKRFDRHIRELGREIPAEALPKEEQEEFQRLKSRVRRFSIEDTYNHSTPILLKTDFTMGQFDRLAISEDDNYSIAEALPSRLAIVNAPRSKPGKRAARFTVPLLEGAFRSELSVVHERGFQQRWYSARIFIPDDWIDELGPGADIVMQWHAIPGNWRATYPNMALNINHGEWTIRRSFGSPQTKPDRETLALGKVKKGSWTHWMFRVNWSPTENGRIEVWQNGNQVVDHRGPNVYGTIGVEYTPYLKFGIYHPSWKSSPVAPDQPTVYRSVYITDVLIADERATRELIETAFAQ